MRATLLLATKCAWTRMAAKSPVPVPVSRNVGFDFGRSLSTADASIVGRRPRPFVIGVGGPSGSGKTILTSVIQSNLEKRFRESLGRTLNVVRTSLDVFYRPLTPDEFKLHVDGKINFDHPDSLDELLMEDTLQRLIGGKETVKISGYDYSTCDRSVQGTVHYSPPFDFIILEGTLALHFQSLRNLYDLKIYVDMDLDSCLTRRIIRDQAERGRTVDHILKQWANTVQPASIQFCLPTKDIADIVLKGDVHDKESLSVLSNYIFQKRLNTNFNELDKGKLDLMTSPTPNVLNSSSAKG